MANRFEWLDRPGAEPEPEQYVAIINALGDWIEAELECRVTLGADFGTMSAPTLTRLIQDAQQNRVEEQEEARTRAIQAGYVWRKDLDR